jgi:HD-GYP domain-containing protein (c-di-GMP phosphodiesterase class II)
MGLLQDVSERKRAEGENQRYIVQLEQSIRSTIAAVSMMGELRDPYTHDRQRRVGEIAAAIASEMGLTASQTEGIRIAGYLHEVGKIALPAEILVKPGKLTPQEYELVKSHAERSHEILKDAIVALGLSLKQRGSIMSASTAAVIRARSKLSRSCSTRACWLSLIRSKRWPSIGHIDKAWG